MTTETRCQPDRTSNALTTRPPHRHDSVYLRAHNNGRSTEKVRPDWGFDWSNVRLAGHVDLTRWLVTFLVIVSKLRNKIKWLLFTST